MVHTWYGHTIRVYMTIYIIHSTDMHIVTVYIYIYFISNV